MLENNELKKPSNNAETIGGAPAIIATAKKAPYIAPIWAVLLAKK